VQCCEVKVDSSSFVTFTSFFIVRRICFLKYLLFCTIHFFNLNQFVSKKRNKSFNHSSDCKI